MAMESHQKELPFAEAEGSRAERKNLLGLAMLKVGVDAEESKLLEWVFNVTDGGTRGQLRKTLNELRATPWGLCCGIDKARASVQRMRRRGLLVVEETWLAGGGQGPNCYQIDWDGIRNLLSLPTAIPVNYQAHRPSAQSEEVGGGRDGMGGVGPAHPRVGPAAIPVNYQAHRPSAQSEEVGGGRDGMGGVGPAHPRVGPAHPRVGPAHPRVGPAHPRVGPAQGHIRNIPLSSLFLAGRPEGSVESEAKTEAPNTTVETAPRWTPESRTTVVAALRRVGYDHQVSSRLARESETVLGLSPDEVTGICEEFLLPANRQRFRRCGAVGYRIRNGSWPADGVVPLHAARKAASTHSDKARSLESERVLREIVLAGRAAKLPESEIRTRLRQSLPADFCQSNGW